MRSLLRSPRLQGALRLWTWPEAPLALVSVAMIELLGPNSADDIADIPFVLVLPLLLMLGCSVVRYRELPLTRAILRLASAWGDRLRSRLVLSLGLDFHPDRHPRLPAFHEMHRLVAVLTLAALAVFPAPGLARELLAGLREHFLYTGYAVALCVVWAALLIGIAVQVPAIVLDALEVVKGRMPYIGFTRIAVVVGFMVVVTIGLVLADHFVGLQGCLWALAVACLLPNLLRPVEPRSGPWLNIALGRDASPRTSSLSDVIGCVHRLVALESFIIVALLMPAGAAVGTVVDVGPFPVTDLLLRVYGWSAAWLLTGGAALAVIEFNRRRRRSDPAFPRQRVLWALPGPEADVLRGEQAAVAASGWQLVIDNEIPGPEEADLLVGAPEALAPVGAVPLVKVPPALFVMTDQGGQVLEQADEQDKSRRARERIEHLLLSTRPHLGERGEGTFLVPHCWLVVGLTRDDERGSLDRPPTMTFGQSYQAMLGTRLRRYLHEVMSRSGLDVIYIEDAVKPKEVGDVLARIFDRHVRRVVPPEVGEADFIGLQGLRVVLHDVDPEVESLTEVDAHVTRHAISRARILIIGRDKGDDGDDDDPPSEGESGDLWLRESLRRLFPRLQPV